MMKCFRVGVQGIGFGVVAFRVYGLGFTTETLNPKP